MIIWQLYERCLTRVLVFGLFAMAYGANSAQAQIIPREDGAFNKVPDGKVWSSPKRFGELGTTALVFLDANRLVVALQSLPKPGMFASTTLSFYGREGNALVETHRFVTELPLVQMYPNRDADRLITTWTIGTTYRTGIFAWHKSGDFRVVLWQDWKYSEPEFLGDANRVIFGVSAMRDEPPNMANDLSVERDGV